MLRVFAIFVSLAIVHFLLYKLAALPFMISLDHVIYTHTLLEHMRTVLLHGEWPLWFPQSFAGTPALFLGSIDLKILPLLKVMTSLDAMVLWVSIQMIFGGVTYVYVVRDLFGFELRAAIYGALFWTLNGFILWYGYDTPYMALIYWMPPLVWAAVRFSERPFLAHSVLLLGLCDMLMTGRPDCVELFGTGVFVFSAIYLAQNATTQREALIEISKRAGVLLGFLFLAALVCYPFLRQQLDLLHDSSRFHTSQGGLTFHTTLINFFNIVPNSEMFFFFREGLGSRAYLGAFNLFLVFWACKRRNGERNYLPYLIAAVITCLFMYDFKILWVLNLFKHVYKNLPGHEGVRSSLRFLPVFFLFISIPLTAGFAQLLNSREQLEKGFQKFRLGLLVFLIALLPFIFAHLHVPQAKMLLLMLTMNVALLAGIYHLRRYWSLACLSLVISAYLANWMVMGVDPMTNFKKIAANPVNQSYLEKLRPIATGYRFMYLGPEFEGVTEYLLGEGIDSINGYLPLVDGRFSNYFVGDGTEADVYLRINPKKIDLGKYDEANVKYWLVEKSVAPEILPKSDNFKMIYEFPSGLRLFESLTAKPRLQFMDTVGSNSKSMGEAKIISRTNSTVDITTNSATGGILLLRESYDRRWKAKIDGKPAEVLRANSIFRALQVPAGVHQIEFIYGLL